MSKSIDIRSLFPSVRDQGDRPTCLAFALSDTHSAVRGVSDHHSAEYLYYHGIQRMPLRDPEGGLTISAGTDALEVEGQPIEAGWPYLTALPSPVASWVPPKSSEEVHAVGTVRKAVPAEIRRQLDATIPTVLGVQISKAFMKVNSQGILPTIADDSSCGGHAMVAVGYGVREGKPAILIRNSWGPAWGDKGHAWLEDSYLLPRLICAATILPHP